jgi:hypothetical protein
VLSFREALTPATTVLGSETEGGDNPDFGNEEKERISSDRDPMVYIGSFLGLRVFVTIIFIFQGIVSCLLWDDNRNDTYIVEL